MSKGKGRIVVTKASTALIPQGVTAEQAAVIPSAALSSLGPLRYAAKLQLGETVLINGATSVSGMLVVQIAKALGAGLVIGTGRNPESGEKLKALGADAFIVILDYLWGHPAEVIINSFTPTGLGGPSRRTRFIRIGGLAGRTAQISGQSMLTSGLEIYGMTAQTLPEAQAESANLVWDILNKAN